jgi:hypothetical protein
MNKAAPKKSIPRFIGLLFLVASLFGGYAAVSGFDATGAVESKAWPPVQLRGYGTVSGDYARWNLPGGGASILHIGCESSDKAKLVHAKYLSDLGVLPGIRDVAATTAGFSCHECGPGGFAFTAGLTGNDVFLFEAANAADLASLVQKHLGGNASGMVFTAQTTVPMFLDRWDRFGFRFYYVPGEGRSSAPGTAKVPYDFKQDLDFLQSTNTGLVLWNGPLDIDGAEGIMRNWSRGDWAFDGAKARNIPLAINDSMSTPSWAANRYRSDIMVKMPGYVGSFHTIAGLRPNLKAGGGLLSLSSIDGRDAVLAQIQQLVRRANADPNVVSWLAADGEIPITVETMLSDGGPTATAGFRRYLQDHYHDAETVNKRWYGDSRRISSWDDIHVPDLASFLGGGADSGAIDLTGKWRIGYESGPGGKVYTRQEIDKINGQVSDTLVPTDPAPEDWFKPDFDDSTWPELTAPGDDTALFLPKQPAVFRRNFDLDAATRKKSDHWWLYVWDFNKPHAAKMWAVLNGVKVGESQTGAAHWVAFEVTSQLRDGSNQLSLRLPQGFLGYRVYLSPVPVRSYPNLGEGKNAEWVDFIGWITSTYMEELHRDVEMVRQIDPNRQITFMHPDDFSEQMKMFSEDYGAEFHCTGYMLAFYANSESMLMRGSDLPFSQEPGSPASNLQGFKHQMGLTLTEGSQGIDYFRSIGDLLWKDEVRTYFQDHLASLTSVGKYHQPKAETALLIDSGSVNLQGFPWGRNPDVVLSGGYWPWNISAGLLETFPTDAVTVNDFARGNAAKYKVILDTNTSIMDEAVISQIERYVRDGGVFVTFAQTGRHTPTQQDAWPIERLTGYHVTHIDRNEKEEISETQPISPAPGQDIIPQDDWNGDTKPNGLTLQKVAPECRDLMLWQNGGVAIGMRQLGKGSIIEVGVKFSGTRISDRWEKQPSSGDMMTAKLFTCLLDKLHIPRLPASLPDPFSPILWQHYVSNNGLYDVWNLWNRDKDAVETTSLRFEKGLNPAWCLELKNTPAPVPVAQADGGSKLDNLQLEPGETRIFLTPRAHPEYAISDWFELQRNWWRGTTPVRKSLPPFSPKMSLNLYDDWSFRSLEAGDNPAALAAPDVDTGSWEKCSIGSWGIDAHRGIKHALLRKTFTVPADWNQGEVFLWLTSWDAPFLDNGNIFLDGKLISQEHAGIAANAAGGALLPGTTHTLAVEIQGDGFLVGSRAPAWLSYLPRPDNSVDLSGEWSASDDYLTFNKTVSFPGLWTGVAAKRTVTIDQKLSGKNVIVDFDGPYSINGVMVNGTWIEHQRTFAQTRWQINITPFVQFGGDNVIELIGTTVNERDNRQASVKMDFYTPGVYP